jgi:hypothetical protein
MDGNRVDFDRIWYIYFKKCGSIIVYSLPIRLRVIVLGFLSSEATLPLYLLLSTAAETCIFGRVEIITPFL